MPLLMNPEYLDKFPVQLWHTAGPAVLAHCSTVLQTCSSTVGHLCSSTVVQVHPNAAHQFPTLVFHCIQFYCITNQP